MRYQQKISNSLQKEFTLNSGLYVSYGVEAGVCASA